jgi:Tfp pilus assembly protein PilN
MDMKKEIKLSDLFKRREKAPKTEKAHPAAVSGETKPPRTSFLKKDVQLSFGRRRKDFDETDAPKQPKQPKEPKQAKERRRKGRAQNGVPALQAVPLMRAFNLLPKDDARQKAEAGRRPSTPQLILAVLGLVLIAGIVSTFLLMNARVADKQKTYDDLRQQVAARDMPVEEPQEDPANAELVKERQERTSALATALGARVTWDRLLREFSLVLPDDVWLTSITAKAPAAADPAAAGQPAPTTAAISTFEIRGYTNEQDGVARLLARMAVLPELASVQLVSSTRVEVSAEEVVEFAITATVKPTGVGATA